MQIQISHLSTIYSACFKMISMNVLIYQYHTFLTFLHLNYNLLYILIIFIIFIIQYNFQ